MHSATTQSSRRLNGSYAQCGHTVCPEIQTFKQVNGPKLGGAKEKVVKAAAGITFSVVLTESGKGEWPLSDSQGTSLRALVQCSHSEARRRASLGTGRQGSALCPPESLRLILKKSQVRTPHALI